MTKATPIIMVGAAGRMGRMILECAGSSDEPYQLIAAIEAPSSPFVGKELGSFLYTAPPSFRVTDAMPERTPPGTVAIIFATVESTLLHLKWAEATGNGVVIGTTGFTEEQRAYIHQVARRAPLILAPNTSVGVNVLFELVAQAVKLLGPGFDIEVVEMHHRFKKDSPSGTARRIAEVALEARGGDYHAHVRNGRAGMVGERTKEELGMHALRGGDVVGDHTVVLAGLGERIELTHRAHTRENFARGALRAASWLSGKAPGVYSMKDVLGL